MILVWSFLAFWIGVLLTLAFGIWYGGRDLPKKIKGPHIPLDSPCPACGHRDCKVDFLPAGLLKDHPTAKVKRTCQVCGCVVEQDPIAPDLFKK